MMPIVIAPNSVLAQQARTVAKIDGEIKKLIEEMKESLAAARDPQGVGLAAPQVGRDLQIFLAKPTEKSPYLVFINPRILEIKERTKTYTRKRKVKGKMEKLEGCLSIPSIWGPVLRSPTLTLSYLDENGAKHTKKFSGFLATIIQHEMDHLGGVLFPKRVLEQKGKLYKSRKDKEGKDIFEEINI